MLRPGDEPAEKGRFVMSSRRLESSAPGAGELDVGKASTARGCDCACVQIFGEKSSPSLGVGVIAVMQA